MKLWSKVKTDPDQMTLQSDVKIKNISKLTWIYLNTILKILIKSVPDVIKTTSSTFLKTSESEESIEHNIIFIKQRFHPRFVKKKIFFCEFWSNIADIHNFDIWLESCLVGFCIDFWSKFHLGTKSPMSGKKMSHWSSVFVDWKSLKEAPTKRQ